MMKKIFSIFLMLAIIVTAAIPFFTTEVFAEGLSSSYASSTHNIDGYDVDNTENLFGNTHSSVAPWVPDKNAEDLVGVTASDGIGNGAYSASINYSDELGVPARGQNGLKITRHINFTLPHNIEAGSYYIFSFYIYTKPDFSDMEALSCYIGLRNYSGCQKKYEGIDCYTKANWKAGEWTKVSLVMYADAAKKWTFGIGTKASSEKFFYIDDFSLIKLPNDISLSALAFDEINSLNAYSEELDNKTSVFGEDTIYRELCSPVNGTTYSSKYLELLKLKKGLDPNTIFGKNFKVGVSYNISDYDVSSSENLYLAQPQLSNKVVDAKIENSDSVTDITPYKQAKDNIVKFSDENIPSKSGEKCLKISDKTSLTLPSLKKNTYYIFSFYMYTKLSVPTNNSYLIKFYDRSWTGMQYQCYDYATEYSDLVTGKWTQVSFVIYSGKMGLLYISFGEGNPLGEENYFYVDDFSLIELPEDVQNDALLFDDYKGNFTNIDELATVGTAFEKNGKYGKLCSPVNVGHTYNEKYEKLLEARMYALSGNGDPVYYEEKTCDDRYNLIENPDCDSEQYWSENSEGYSVTSVISQDEFYEGKSSLKVNGNNEYFIKWIDGIEPNTDYFISLYGMTPISTPLNDIHFGIMDKNKAVFRNQRSEDISATINLGTFDEITISCQDGNWYNRSYLFNSGENTKIGIYFTGSSGVMYFDSLKLFKAEYATTVVEKGINRPISLEFDIPNYACNKADNLIKNGSFDKGVVGWEDIAYGKCVEKVVSSGNNMLYYRNDYQNAYYMPEFKIEKGKFYTFSFWARAIEGSGAVFGLVNATKPCEYITDEIEICEDQGNWKLYSVTFSSEEEEAVCFAIYDGGGAAVFDKFRLFESDKGIVVDPEQDKPIGGVEFVTSLKKPIIGIMPYQDDEVSQPEDAPTSDDLKNEEVIDEPYQEESNKLYEEESEVIEENGDETVTVVKKILKKKVKNKSGDIIPVVVWIIGGVIAAGIIAVVCILIIIKRRNKGKVA